MTSSLLRSATALVHPLLLLLSVFLLVRGHDEPGGGFAGGLVAASAFVLQALAFGPERVRRSMAINPQRLVGIGLLIAAASGLPGAIEGKPFLGSLWIEAEVPVLGRVALGTPLLFDLGVYATVVGMVVLVVLLLEEARR